VLELQGWSARSPVLGRDRDTNGCYANGHQLQAVMHIMTHRSEDFAGKTESSLAVNAGAIRQREAGRSSTSRWRSLAQTGRSTRSILDRVAHALALVQPGSLVELSMTISRS
jgi:hypothetical protein